MPRYRIIGTFDSDEPKLEQMVTGIIRVDSPLVGNGELVVESISRILTNKEALEQISHMVHRTMGLKKPGVLARDIDLLLQRWRDTNG